MRLTAHNKCSITTIVEAKRNYEMANTKDCKQYLADFVQKNPSIVTSIYGGEYEPVGLLQDATNPNKWKRDYKCNPGGGRYEFDEYSMFDQHTIIKRMGYDRLKKMPATNFVAERGFYLNPDIYDTGVAFVVLEDKDGNLHLGDYIGD
jgi:hypothetical protein